VKLQRHIARKVSLYRISKALDVTMERLLTGEEIKIRKEGLH